VQLSKTSTLATVSNLQFKIINLYQVFHQWGMGELKPPQTYKFTKTHPVSISLLDHYTFLWINGHLVIGLACTVVHQKGSKLFYWWRLKLF